MRQWQTLDTQELERFYEEIHNEETSDLHIKIGNGRWQNFIDLFGLDDVNEGGDRLSYSERTIVWWIHCSRYLRGETSDMDSI